VPTPAARQERIIALRTLLPLLGMYRSLMQGGSITQRLPTVETLSGQPQAGWKSRDCDGECSVYGPGCEYSADCRGEAWERCATYWARAYRMDAVDVAYRWLEEHRRVEWVAVRAVYVDPYDRRSEPVRLQSRQDRQKKADEGLEIMAARIRGRLVGFEQPKVTLAEQVHALVDDGVVSPSDIARRVGCSVRHAKRLKAAVGGRA